MVEHLAVNEVVPGSSPGFGAVFRELLARSVYSGHTEPRATLAYVSELEWTAESTRPDRTPDRDGESDFGG